MDEGLNRLAGKDWAHAARAFYGVYSSLPEGDLRRDTAGFHLASALVELGYTQAGVEHYIEVVAGRRVPELVAKALSALLPLYQRHLVDEGRFTDGVLYGSSFGELPNDVGDFVEYLQAKGDLRRGYGTWGRTRLETLAKAKRPYSYHARYSLAVDRLSRHDDDAAEKEMRAIGTASDCPPDVKAQARLALGRSLYERQSYDDAWKVYAAVEMPLPLKDSIMIEQAWDRVAAGDQQRALGVLVGLGAPVFRDIFAPERDLIRALALRRLCQYRAAYVTVRQFRAAYGPSLRKIRERAPLKEDPAILKWATRGTKTLADQSRMKAVLEREGNAGKSESDGPLAEHLAIVYGAGLSRVDLAITRGLPRALDEVSDELLRIDEQMSLITYEIGAGLFKSGGDTGGGASAPTTLRKEDIPIDGPDAYFKFDGEYWSDEVDEYSVLSQDRCVR
jgi:hypothetical protein